MFNGNFQRILFRLNYLLSTVQPILSVESSATERFVLEDAWGGGGKLMAQRCAHYAPLVRPLCAHYVFETVWGETDGPYMRPLCAYCAPTMRPLSV